MDVPDTLNLIISYLNYDELINILFMNKLFYNLCRQKLILYFRDDIREYIQTYCNNDTQKFINLLKDGFKADFSESRKLNVNLFSIWMSLNVRFNSIFNIRLLTNIYLVLLNKFDSTEGVISRPEYKSVQIDLFFIIYTKRKENK